MSDRNPQAVLIVPEQIVKTNLIEPSVEQAPVKTSPSKISNQKIHFSAKHFVQPRKGPATPENACVRCRDSSFPAHAWNSCSAMTRS